jgi:hypothetical protein
MVMHATGTYLEQACLAGMIVWRLGMQMDDGARRVVLLAERDGDALIEQALQWWPPPVWPRARVPT